MQQVEFFVNEEMNTVTAHVDNSSYELPALWLRERCQDELHLDHVTQQRLFDPHQLDVNLLLTSIKKLEDNQYYLSFSDGYEGSYNFDEFLADFDTYDGSPTPTPWAANFDKSVFYVDFIELRDEQGILKALEKFLTYGVLIVNDIPDQSDMVLEVAEKFGHVRETNFGRSFEVYTRPDYIDLSSQSIPLGPHTDNPYRDPMPGIQLLHCIKNETSGGLSTLVDSLSVLSQLKEEDPEGYKLLSTVPVRYRHIDKSIELISRRTMIESDFSGRVTGISYSPRLDYLPLISQEELIIFHRARQRLGELLNSSHYEWKFKLEPGQLQMFHNTRVLHGRSGFDASEGLRHLQGAYIDLDAPKGRFKAVKRKLGL